MDSSQSPPSKNTSGNDQTPQKESSPHQSVEEKYKVSIVRKGKQLSTPRQRGSFKAGSSKVSNYSDSDQMSEAEPFMGAGPSIISNMSDFQELQKLGDGSYSQVFLVRRKKDATLYALKKVKITEMNQKDRDNAINEVRILASIKHPNVVSYREAFIDNNKLW